MTIQLTHHARFGGCAAKIGPEDLSEALCGIEIPEDNNVIVGLKGFEDAGVYRLRDDLAVVQTVDFFTPVVNDPYHFGRIAAANALSDVYAMGARPTTAMNIVCFSPKKYGTAVLREIIKGGIDKLKESSTSLLGGHSVQDEETKYGLSVTGLVHPDKIVRNDGAVAGDLLVLTKPLGTGVLITALKANAVSEQTEKHLIDVMAALNDRASEAMLAAGTHAATDVTGFGLAGHLKEMIGERLGVEIYADKLPFLAETQELTAEEFFPAGFYKNRDFYSPSVDSEASGFLHDLIYDPQSSGGLLIALDPDTLDVFDREAAGRDLTYWLIGRFLQAPKGRIAITEKANKNLGKEKRCR